jgi:hypothetical protein
MLQPDTDKHQLLLKQKSIKRLATHGVNKTVLLGKAEFSTVPFTAEPSP